MTNFGDSVEEMTAFEKKNPWAIWTRPINQEHHALPVVSELNPTKK